MPPPHPLNQAVVAQALHDLRNGQLRRCKSMGLGDEDLEALREPAMASALANALVSWCSVTVNNDVFKRLVKKAREAEFDMTVVDRMLRLGASTAMVGKFHGLTHQDVARRRELLGLPKRRGRHRVLDEQQDADLWAQWKVLAKQCQVDTNDVVAVLGVAMDLAERMSLPLSVVWTTLMGWLDEGLG
ncbi:TPA: DUF2857 domain-containing protein [Pseudomonas aeruginosa]